MYLQCVSRLREPCLLCKGCNLLCGRYGNHRDTEPTLHLLPATTHGQSSRDGPQITAPILTAEPNLHLEIENAIVRQLNGFNHWNW